MVDGITAILLKMNIAIVHPVKSMEKTRIRNQAVTAIDRFGVDHRNRWEED